MKDAHQSRVMEINMMKKWRKKGERESRKDETKLRTRRGKVSERLRLV